MSRAVDWVRPGINTNQPVWGVRGGLMWALPPGGFRPRGEPGGLIRVGYPILTNGAYDLVNFIAVEPIVRGRKGFSELKLHVAVNARSSYWGNIIARFPAACRSRILKCAKSFTTGRNLFSGSHATHHKN